MISHGKAVEQMHSKEERVGGSEGNRVTEHGLSPAVQLWLMSSGRKLTWLSRPSPCGNQPQHMAPTFLQLFQLPPVQRRCVWEQNEPVFPATSTELMFFTGFTSVASWILWLHDSICFLAFRLIGPWVRLLVAYG